MAAHAVEGYMDPTHGYVKQLRTASHGLDTSSEEDLQQPTSQLIATVSKLAKDLEECMEKIWERCTGAEFPQQLKTIDGLMTDLEGQKKHVQSQLSGLKNLGEKDGHHKPIA